MYEVSVKQRQKTENENPTSETSVETQPRRVYTFFVSRAVCTLCQIISSRYVCVYWVRTCVRVFFVAATGTGSLATRWPAAREYSLYILLCVCVLAFPHADTAPFVWHSILHIHIIQYYTTVVYTTRERVVLCDAYENTLTTVVVGGGALTADIYFRVCSASLCANRTKTFSFVQEHIQCPWYAVMCMPVQQTGVRYTDGQRFYCVSIFSLLLPFCVHVVLALGRAHTHTSHIHHTSYACGVAHEYNN